MFTSEEKIWLAITYVGVLSIFGVCIYYLKNLIISGKGADERAAGLSLFSSELKGNIYTQLAAMSFLMLFCELSLTRWISSEIRIFAYFKNFVLVACFLGFGIG